MPSSQKIPKIYWLFLLGSILLEVLGTSIMKISQTNWPLTGLIAMYILLGLSYFCLAKAVIRLPIGVAYAFWEGLGILLITLVSTLILQEHLGPKRVLALCLIVAGTLLVNHGTDVCDSQDITKDRRHA